jgi:magnesium transporter
MKIYKIQDDALCEVTQHEEINFEHSESGFVCICSAEEWEKQTSTKIAARTVRECGISGSSKHEAYDGYDFIALNILNEDTLYTATDRIGMYIMPNALIFVRTKPVKAVQDVIDFFMQNQTMNFTIFRVIFYFFDQLTVNDSQRLVAFEEEVSALEEQVIENTSGDYIKSIIDMRKRLMFLKKYYEQLLDVAESIEENENSLLDSCSIKYFKMFTGRIDRLNRNIQNLRDYITQVREAYQSQVDISLNQVMKIFTVVTAIFLPLTLIAGWYGMNFSDMPELHWPYGYFYAIGISIAFVVISILFFKRKKLL